MLGTLIEHLLLGGKSSLENPSNLHELTETKCSEAEIWITDPVWLTLSPSPLCCAFKADIQSLCSPKGENGSHTGGSIFLPFFFCVPTQSPESYGPMCILITFQGHLLLSSLASPTLHESSIRVYHAAIPEGALVNCRGMYINCFMFSAGENTTEPCGD